MTDEQALETLVALGDPVRFEIFRRLLKSPAGSAGQLIDNKAPATMSHHLKIMERAGLLTAKRNGRHVQYTLRGETLSAFANWSHSVAERAVLNQLSDWFVSNPQG